MFGDRAAGRIRRGAGHEDADHRGSGLGRGIDDRRGFVDRDGDLRSGGGDGRARGRHACRRGRRSPGARRRFRRSRGPPTGRPRSRSNRCRSGGRPATPATSRRARVDHPVAASSVPPTAGSGLVSSSAGAASIQAEAAHAGRRSGWGAKDDAGLRRSTERSRYRLRSWAHRRLAPLRCAGFGEGWVVGVVRGRHAGRFSILVEVAIRERMGFPDPEVALILRVLDSPSGRRTMKFPPRSAPSLGRGDGRHRAPRDPAAG